jgi:hypothetical protein
MWFNNIWYGVAGMLLANGIPHFIHGVSGEYWPKTSRMIAWVNEQTPRTKTMTSPLVNVIWGWINLVGAFCLLRGIGHFQIGLTGNMLALASGTFVGGVFLAWNFAPRSQ